MKQYRRFPTKQFRKDVRRLKKSGYDLSKLEFIINLLASEMKLPDHYHDHELRGALAGTRECHIKPDWLLRYAKDGNRLVLILIGTGTHRDVFGIE